jgi:hypothetical protein
MGLNAIVLAPGSPRLDGWHRRGIVAVCAWEVEQEIVVSSQYFEDHKKILTVLDVPCVRIFDQDDYDCHCGFNSSTIRAYQLLHILLHELGHHHDRMTTRSKRHCGRGEGFAERYALSYFDRIRERYLNEFGLP